MSKECENVTVEERTEAQAAAPVATKKADSRKRAERIFIVAMLAVPVLHWLIWWLYVNVSTFVLAFQDNLGNWSLINFKTLYYQLITPYGDTIGLAFRNTCKYFATNVFIIFPCSVFISYFIFKRIMGYKVFRVLFFLPAIISGVAMTTVFGQFISPLGPLGSICKWLGIALPEQGLLNGPATATPTIILYTVWTGFCTNVILISSAMSRIPTEILESARLEGCKPLRELIQIVLPMTWSTLQTLLIFILTGILNASGPILLFSPEGANETTTLAFWIFKQVYGNGELGGTGNYGLVSCAGLCFSLVFIPIIMLVRKLFEKIPAVEY